MNNSCKILVIDDEPLLKSLVLQTFKPLVASKQLEFYFAENGKEALQILEENHEIGVILTDIKMSEMDGLTLMHQLSLKDRPYKVVVISAYGDMNNIRKAMEEGASDFILKPFDIEDFKTSVLNAVAQYQYLKQGMLARDRIKELSKELEIAKQMKKAFIPTDFFPFGTSNQMLFAGEILSSEKQLGGDFFDFFPLNEKELGVVVAKVSAKGLPAALYTAMIQMLIRADCTNVNACQCVNSTYQFLLKELPPDLIQGLLFASINIQTGEFIYCNVGEIHAYLLSENTHERTLIQGDGKLTLKPLDKVFITTKELFQALDNERLNQLLDASYSLSPNELILKVKETFQQFLNLPLQADIPIFALQKL